jgi:hypothetical protein
VEDLMATRASQNTVGNNSTQILVAQAVRQGNDFSFTASTSIGLVTATSILIDENGNPIGGGGGSSVSKHIFNPGFNC